MMKFFQLGLMTLLLLTGNLGRIHAQSDPMPSQLQSFRGLLNPQFIDAERYVEDRSIGRVTNIQVGHFTDSRRKEMVLVGVDGVAFFDANGAATPHHKIMFTPSNNTYVQLVGKDSRGEMLFVERGGDPTTHAFTPRLFNQRGQQSWTHGGGMSPVINLPWLREAPTSKQFLAVRRDALDLLDQTGRVMGTLPSNEPILYAQTADLTQNGLEEIITLHPNGRIMVRDQTGEVVGQGSFPNPPKFFTTVPCPNQRDLVFLVAPENETIGLYDWNGRPLTSVRAPYVRPDRVGVIEAVCVRLVPGRGDYLAILVQFPAWERSILYVYDSEDAELVYARSVPGYVTSLASLDINGDGVEFLFTGGNGNAYHNRVLSDPPTRRR